ncbi:MAG: hydrolase superfamily-like protein [Acidimicrobiaceae bacterium]|nr:hydrolase superfamily-like protein [Acidimicrobiaceae bacterium]
MTWLLCDYGEVLSLPQDPDKVSELVRLSGLDPEVFSESYWAHRVAYDRADLSASQFWRAVLRAPEPLAEELLAQLIELDVAGWTRPSEPSLAAVDRAVRRGLRPALLSNAPHEVARVADGQEWLASFSPRLFSCDLGEVKPDPAVYALALEALGASGDEVVFVDDKQVNVAAAREAGITAYVFDGPDVFDKV